MVFSNHRSPGEEKGTKLYDAGFYPVILSVSYTERGLKRDAWRWGDQGETSSKCIRCCRRSDPTEGLFLTDSLCLWLCFAPVDAIDWEFWAKEWMLNWMQVLQGTSSDFPLENSSNRCILLFCLPEKRTEECCYRCMRGRKGIRCTEFFLSITHSHTQFRIPSSLISWPPTHSSPYVYIEKE